VIAWHLGSEVCGVVPDDVPRPLTREQTETMGEWIETRIRVDDEWSGASGHPEIQADQHNLHEALTMLEDA
jgi:hypothetical protein